MYERQVYVVIHWDLSVAGNLQKRWAQKVSGKTSESVFRIFWRIHRSSGVRGSPEESHNENLELELAKFFNPKG